MKGLCLCAGAALAQVALDDAPVREELLMNCNFVTECFEDEACTDVEYEPQLTGQTGGASDQDMVVEADFESPAGTEKMLGVMLSGALSLSGGSFAARHLLTVNADGAARYSVHYADGPMVISYLGTCE
ncbi:MAG: hypothetical protein AAF218_08160 [Pseudomonadota bacterium]